MQLVPLHYRRNNQQIREDVANWGFDFHREDLEHIVDLLSIYDMLEQPHMRDVLGEQIKKFARFRRIIQPETLRPRTVYIEVVKYVGSTGHIDVIKNRYWVGTPDELLRSVRSMSIDLEGYNIGEIVDLTSQVLTVDNVSMSPEETARADEFREALNNYVLYKMEDEETEPTRPIYVRLIADVYGRVGLEEREFSLQTYRDRLVSLYEMRAFLDIYDDDYIESVKIELSVSRATPEEDVLFSPFIEAVEKYVESKQWRAARIQHDMMNKEAR